MCKGRGLYLRNRGAAGPRLGSRRGERAPEVFDASVIDEFRTVEDRRTALTAVAAAITGGRYTMQVKLSAARFMKCWVMVCIFLFLSKKNSN